MSTIADTHKINHPLNVASKDFTANKYMYYGWLRDHAPVYKGKMMVMNVYFLSRYEDCLSVLKDPRFVRNRATATGSGGKLPFPVPKSVALASQSMIIADEPEHRRLRNLVHKAFTPRSLARLESRIEQLTHQLLDELDTHGTVDLKQAYALPVPVTVISEMMGVSSEDMPKFIGSMRVLTTGFSGWSVVRALLWDLRKTTSFVRELIERKRQDPQDDILTALIQAEEDGEHLSEDELVSMVILLIVAGYETTVHLITNTVVALLQHPDQLARLREQPELMPSAIEEVLRFLSPVQGTKPMYPTEDIRLHGRTIPRGATVMPLLGAANRDPRTFADPDVFDIARTPNHHLGFGQGIHYCLGAPLARMEARIAVKNLLDRSPNLRLAVDPETLNIQRYPMWHRYDVLPVILG